MNAKVQIQQVMLVAWSRMYNAIHAKNLKFRKITKVPNKAVESTTMRGSLLR